LIKKIDDKELNVIISKKINKLFITDENDNLIMLNDKISKKLIKEKKANIKFTMDQKKAIRKICKFLPDINSRTFGLYGYAGTGKTTTIVEILTYLLRHKIVQSVVFTAPTNKAVNVIKSKFRIYLRELYNSLHDDELPHYFDFEEIIDKLYVKGIQIEFTTIHKLLKFELDFNMEGDLIFIRSNGESLINQYELIIIDECSMIPLKIVDNILNEVRFTAQRGSNNYKKIPKIIFCGDPAQLPPVHENKSSIFINSKKDLSLKTYVDLIYNSSSNIVNDGINEKINYDDYSGKYKLFIDDICAMPTYTLKKVMRSKLDAVTNVCLEIRLWVMGDIIEPNLKQYEGQQGIKFYEYIKKSNKTTTKWFKRCLNKIKNGDLYNIIITWTNPQAIEYNKALRQAIFNKQQLDTFEEGDMLIINDFYNIDDGNLTYKTVEKNENKFYTSEQIKIIKIEKITKEVNKFPLTLNKTASKLQNAKYYETQYKAIIDGIHKFTNKLYTCWKLSVKRITESNSGTDQDDDIYTVYVIHESSLAHLANDKKTVMEYIKKLRRLLVNKFRDKGKQIETNIIKPLWRDWHKIYVEPYANINYGYSITCHKGQGSNFYNVFVDIDDMGKNPNNDETKHCIYTAATRATNELYLLI